MNSNLTLIKMNSIDLTLKITKKLGPVYKKVHGGYFGIFTAILGILTVIVASILFYSVEPFTMYSHWISNLGGVETNSGKSPNGSNLVFSIGLITMSVTSVIFVLYLVNLLLSSKNQKFPRLVVCCLIFGVLSLLGNVGIAFFDMKSQPMLHVYSAIVLFVSLTFTIFFFSISMFFNKDVSKIQAIIGLIVIIITLILFASFLPLMLEGYDLLTLMTSTSSELAITRFWEWMSFFAFLSWFFELGVYTLKFK